MFSTHKITNYHAHNCIYNNTFNAMGFFFLSIKTRVFINRKIIVYNSRSTLLQNNIHRKRDYIQYCKGDLYPLLINTMLSVLKLTYKRFLTSIYKYIYTYVYYLVLPFCPIMLQA